MFIFRCQSGTEICVQEFDGHCSLGGLQFQSSQASGKYNCNFNFKISPCGKMILPNYQDATKEINTKTRRNTSTKSYTVDFKNLASCILSVPRNILTEAGSNLESQLLRTSSGSRGGRGSKRLEFSPFLATFLMLTISRFQEDIKTRLGVLPASGSLHT